MFYVGSNVLDWPIEAQRAITDGTPSLHDLSSVCLMIVLLPLGHEICVRKCIDVFRNTCSKCALEDTWSHRYSQNLFSHHEIMFDVLSSDGFQQPRCIRGVVLQLVLSRSLSCGSLKTFAIAVRRTQLKGHLLC